MSILVEVVICQTGEKLLLHPAALTIVVGMDADDDAGRIDRVPYLDTPISVWSPDEPEIDGVGDLLVRACDASVTFNGNVDDWREDMPDRVAYVQTCLNDRDDPMSRWWACRLTGDVS